jgi:hypothetical protein
MMPDIVRAFLSVDAFEDFITKKYLKILQNFAKDVVFQLRIKRRSDVHESLCKLFSKNDQFEETFK